MGMGMGPRAAQAPGCGRGFTLIELVVCIGIIMILIGLIAPSLGRAMSRAKLIRDVGTVRQQAMLISMYAADFEDTYPLADDRLGHLFSAAGNWGVPLIESGHADSVAQLDPDVDRGLEPSFLLSIAMVFDANQMRPGHVPPVGQQRPRAVRTHQVLFPSSKALTFRLWDGQPNETFGGINVFCCAAAFVDWPTPVSFADGSAASGTMREFLDGDSLYMEHDIGAPVYSTWFGIRGRDR
ncbi:MAG: prepilin-type N-terminal cleavage/methylation domain-containing protein [Phycisphaerales bacterium]|nr:prepilin-type N-terminal cleavage/methylation domain-containing protein [Phycisphaerales bacterium]